MSLPLLYSFRRCPYAMRARLALTASSQTVELREIVLRNKPEHMLAISPKGTVPVLQLPDGTVIEESIDIMHWALPNADISTQAQALININDGAFKHGLDRYKYANRYDDEHNGLSAEAFSAQHRDAAAQALLVELENQLAGHQQPYLFGAAPSFADMAIAPFVRQYANTQIDWFQAQQWPHLQRWLQQFLDSGHFAHIMPKFTPWQEGDTPVLLSPYQE